MIELSLLWLLVCVVMFFTYHIKTKPIRLLFKKNGIRFISYCRPAIVDGKRHVKHYRKGKFTTYSNRIKFKEAIDASKRLREK